MLVVILHCVIHVQKICCGLLCYDNNQMYICVSVFIGTCLCVSMGEFVFVYFYGVRTDVPYTKIASDGCYFQTYNIYSRSLKNFGKPLLFSTYIQLLLICCLNFYQWMLLYSFLNFYSTECTEQ